MRLGQPALVPLLRRPLVSDEQFRRVTGYLESGKSDGATTVTGGGRVGDRGATSSSPR